ncbi:MAG: hypothetical protein ACRENB_16645 [Gemmatimonadales bacterium]
MPRATAIVLCALLPPLLSTAAAAQEWNTPEARQLVRRAILLRESPAQDTALRHYRSRAHGFVFYLAQFGRGFPDPPRLAKADELEVEVYWEAPDRSKQRIVRWREGTFLPAVMRYHRDHLGIVPNNFGPRIRIGEGDEVRDAVHPLSLEGLDEYDFALGDTLTLRTGRGPIDVLAVQVRPRSFERPLVVGNLYLERTTAALVRFQFSFTPAAYRDSELEDISVILEQALLEGRWWLPFHQEIEIRRRASVFEFPARAIIRGRWDIEDYDFEVPFPEGLRSAPEFGGLETAQPDTGQWERPLRASAEEAEPFDRQAFDEIKAAAEDLVSRRLLEGMPAGRIGTTAVSDLVRVNRVQGLAFGLGAAFRFHGGYSIRANLGYGLSDHRLTAGFAFGISRGLTEWSIDARRTIRDFGDEPVVSGFVNSLLAQERGIDLGSYVLGEEAGLGFRRRLDARWTLDLAFRFERSTSVDTAATPVTRDYPPNPALGSGSIWLGRFGLTLAPRGALDRSDLKATFGLEGGMGDAEYLRLTMRTDGQLPVPGGHLRLRTLGGWATRGLPRARSFAIGGRGTLPAERFRGYGGRYVAVTQFEYRIPVPVPAIGLGSFASTGRRAILAPMFGAGWAGGPIDGLQWGESHGILPVVGVAAEVLQQLIRIEAATRLRGRRDLLITVDISPEWWPIL